MSLPNPYDEPEFDLDALEGLDDEALLELLEGHPEDEPDEPPRRPITDVRIPIDQYPPAHTEGIES